MKKYLPVEPGKKLDYDTTQPVFVVDSLDELKGAMVGEVVLPLHLDWTPYNRYNLSEPEDVRLLYLTVLSEACSEAELRKYLNRELLLGLWSKIRLPKRIRLVWESTHPELKST